MTSEFDLVQRYFSVPPRRTDVVEGIGDDGAVLRPPTRQDVVVSVDTLLEGVHFTRRASPASIGYKALAVNLSDLAAMGAEPAWATLALTLPAADEAWLAEFSRGFLALARRYEVELIGGDLTRGPLSVTVQIMGLLPAGSAIRRDSARPGDAIFVTGTVGDAGLALSALRDERQLDPARLAYCLQRLDEPSPRVAVGIELRGIATAAIDVSDGLVIDLGRILSASGVGAVVELSCIPLSQAFLGASMEDPDWTLALSAGDDYELVFTVPAERVPVLEQRFSASNYKLTQIGRVEAQAGVRFALHGQPCAPLDCPGYDHFAHQRPAAVDR
jgi:thiamine-monophosphate kinase